MPLTIKSAEEIVKQESGWDLGILDEEGKAIIQKVKAQVFLDLAKRVEPIIEALRFCSKPEGAYSRDHNEHAKNCLLESIKKAEEALKLWKEIKGGGVN